MERAQSLQEPTGSTGSCDFRAGLHTGVGNVLYEEMWTYLAQVGGVSGDLL